MCSTNVATGPILPSITVTSRTPFPVEEPVPAEATVEGRLALGKPQLNSGEAITECDGETGIQVFDGFDEVVSLPEDVHAELYGA